MSIKDEIKMMLIKSGISMTELVRRLNEKHNRNDTVQNLNGKLTRGTLKYSEAKEIAEILGYEVKWVKNDSSETM